MKISLTVTVDVPDDVVSYAESISDYSERLLGEPIIVPSILKEVYAKAIHNTFLSKEVKSFLSVVEDEILLEYDKRRYPEWI